MSDPVDLNPSTPRYQVVTKARAHSPSSRVLHEQNQHHILGVCSGRTRHQLPTKKTLSKRCKGVAVFPQYLFHVRPAAGVPVLQPFALRGEHRHKDFLCEHQSNKPSDQRSWTTWDCGPNTGLSGAARAFMSRASRLLQVARTPRWLAMTRAPRLLPWLCVHPPTPPRPSAGQSRAPQWFFVPTVRWTNRTQLAPEAPAGHVISAVAWPRSSRRSRKEGNPAREPPPSQMATRTTDQRAIAASCSSTEAPLSHAELSQSLTESGRIPLRTRMRDHPYFGWIVLVASLLSLQVGSSASGVQLGRSTST